ELEGDLQRAVVAGAGAGDRAEGAGGEVERGVHTTCLRRAEVFSAVQILTVTPPDLEGGSEVIRTGPRPAAASQRSISSSKKPRRRCWCSARRNSRSCGAKSTMISRPPGATSRAASPTAAAGSER